MATNADKLNELAVSIAQVITDLSGVKVQTSAMYKLLITGNGTKPLPEVVRNHDEWIECQKLAQKELAEAKKEEIKVRREITWKFVLELLGKIVYPIAVAAIAVWLGLSI